MVDSCWRPMETAPKTGAVIIGLGEPKGTDPMVFAMKWDGFNWMRDHSFAHGSFNVSCKPTHWHWLTFPE